MKGFIASMKRTPWRGVLKNECNESSGSFEASALTLWRAGKSGVQPLPDEICVLCGYERKYASKLLGGGRPIAGESGKCRGGSQRIYAAGENAERLKRSG